MGDQAYVKQAEENILSILSEGRYSDAYKKAADLLKLYPEDSSVLRLIEKIEKTVRIENEKVVAAKLKQLSSLWDEEKYAEILSGLKSLIELSPENGKLKALYAKAQKKYKKQIEKLQDKFESEKESKFKELLKINHKELLDELNALEQNNPGNMMIRAFIAKYRDMVIAEKIKEKQDLLNSDKVTEIADFIKDLRYIDPQNKRIEDLEKEMRIRTQKGHVEEKLEYLYKGHEYWNTLMKLKKYDKAVHVSKEMLQIDPLSKVAAKMLKQAERELVSDNKSQSIDKIFKNLPKIKEEYKKSKAEFVRI